MANQHQELALARSVPRFRFHYVDTDAMDPTYRIGDWLIFVPVDDYLHDGVYIIDAFGYPVAYRFDTGPGGLVLLRDNRLYGPGQDVALDWFREHVLGLVLGKLRIPSSIVERHSGMPGERP